MKASKFGQRVSLLVLTLGLLPALSQAHPEFGYHSGFESGTLHPLHGLDHLIAMVAVGLWAAQRGGRSLMALPGAFVLAMIGGFLLSFTSFSLPLFESGITLSVVLLGAFIAFRSNFRLSAATSVVALFGLFHGFAHGTELPTSASGSLFLAGFALSTLVLHAAGAWVGLKLKNAKPSEGFAPSTITRLAGAAICVTGLAFLAI